MQPDREIRNSDQLGSMELFYGLNEIATELQKSIRSEENVFAIFQKQVISLGLRGGISELDDRGEKLVFRTVAFPSSLRKILARFEKRLRTEAVGYRVRVDAVDVYYAVIREGRSVFVPRTNTVSVQVIPHQVKVVVAPLLLLLGSPPGIFTPLVYDGKVKGMLNMVGPLLTERDIPTMQAFANQITVAMENTRLVGQLRSANLDLETAYQKTLEGWIQALELRDDETEGHTLRTAEITVRLARAMGVPDTDLKQIQRGALLHDIGKMAIPDSILKKPGPLSEAEWQVMREHPRIAYHLLSEIEYLRPSAIIPLCHHERWDGSGYGQGLAGERIPLWARIFSVVDVWDAMQSDRPYRKALPAKDTIEFIRQQSGRMFDPRVVEAFLEFINPKTGALKNFQT